MTDATIEIESSEAISHELVQSLDAFDWAVEETNSEQLSEENEQLLSNY